MIPSSPSLLPPIFPLQMAAASNAWVFFFEAPPYGLHIVKERIVKGNLCWVPPYGLFLPYTLSLLLGPP